MRVREHSLDHLNQLKTYDIWVLKEVIIYMPSILYELQYKSYLNFKLFTCNSSCDCTVSIPKS